MGRPQVWKSAKLRDGIVVHAAKPGDIARSAEAALLAGRSLHIVTLNPEIVVAARRLRHYRELLERSDIRTADGVGVALVAGLRSRSWWTRVTGREIVEALVVLSATRGFPLVVLGAAEPSRLRAEAVLLGRGAAVRPGWSGPVDEAGRGIEAAAERVEPRTITLLALGAPKGDCAIALLRRRGVGPAVYVNVGGVIDYLSGAAPEPPRFLRALGMEWAFRLATAPRVRAHRQLALPRFVLRELGLWL